MASAPAIIENEPVDPATPPAAPTPAAPTPPANDPAAPPADPATPPADPAAPPADDWRARLAGTDEKLLGYLSRYQSEGAFVAAAHKDRIAAASKAALKLPENPTDAELAAYRKEHGIPDKAEGYLENLPNGLVVGDDDRPYVDKFVEKMLGANAPKSAADAALSAYYDIIEEQQAAVSEAERVAKDTGIEALREEWGPDYKRNLNAMHGFLETLPEPVANAFKFGKGADGVPLGYNPDVLKWVTSLALEANPLSTVVPGAGANQASAVADEIAKIELLMRTDRNAYNKDEALQARLRELYTAREKIAK